MVEDAGTSVRQSPSASPLRDEATVLLGLAKRMNEATGNDRAPPVQIEMGELAAYAAIVENIVRAAKPILDRSMKLTM